MRAISGLLLQQAPPDGANPRIFHLRPVGKPDRRLNVAGAACDRLKLIDKAAGVDFVIVVIRRSDVIPQEGPHAEIIAVRAGGQGPCFGPADDDSHQQNSGQA
jgi:hypothetical protein